MNFARVGQTGFLFNRKRIEFGAKHHRWARAIFEDGNDSSSANMFSNVVTEIPKATRELCRSLSFMGRKLRILMQVEIERVRVGIDRFDFLLCNVRLGVGGSN